jgi:4-hydroxyproline epimerase
MPDRAGGDALELRVVDSHTEGEPTRVIVDGWPQPAGATMAERRDDLRRNADHLRRGVVCEPRGHAAIVGALLTPPVTGPQRASSSSNETYLRHVRARADRRRPNVAPDSCRPVSRVSATPVGTVSAELTMDR